MKIAVISDIHANWHALDAVWADLEKQRPDFIICLGDLVGDGAHPNEVIDFLRARNIPTVMGNYDDAVGHDLDDCGCAPKTPDDIRRSQQSLLMTQAMTLPEHKAFLRGLPLHYRLEVGGRRWLFVHGSPRRINEYLHADRPAATFESVAKVADCDVLCFGHTHLPYQKLVGRTLFVNAGSVGRPKDGDPRAGYGVIELALWPRVEFHRVPYAAAAAAQAIRAAGLPAYFADALEAGGLAPAILSEGVPL